MYFINFLITNLIKIKEKTKIKNVLLDCPKFYLHSTQYLSFLGKLDSFRWLQA